MENNENKNIDEKQNTEYTFVRETIRKTPPAAVRILLRVLRILGMGAVFGLGVCIVLLIFNKDLRDMFMGGEQKRTESDAENGTTEEEMTEDGVVLSVEERINAGLVDVAAVFYSDSTETLTESVPQEETTALYQEEKTAAISDNKEIQTTTDAAGQATEATQSTPETGVGISDTEETTEKKKIEEKRHFTGIVISKRTDIFICLSYGNIKDADDIYVSFGKGKAVQAELYGSDVLNGIAVLRVKSGKLDSEIRKSILTAELAPADDMSSGDRLVYAGNPFGRGRLFYAGTLAGVDSGHTSYDIFYRGIITDIGNTDIVTDGFLFDENGRVAAMLGALPVEQTAGSNIAGICMEDMMYVVRALANGTAVNHIGVRGDEVTDDMRELAQEDMPQGMYVTDVARESNAYKAGIMVGDIITSAGGEKVTSLKDIQKKLAGMSAGNDITIVLKRKIGTSYNEFTIKVPVEAY